jgi:hypothetical protein
MSGIKSEQERSTKKAGTRKLFYGALGLLLAGLLLVATGALSSSALLMLAGLMGFLGAGVVQLIWLVRRVG